MHRTERRPAPRIAYVCDDARGYPRCAERDRPAFSPVCLRRTREPRGVSGCRRRSGGARRPGPGHPSNSVSASVPAGRRRQRRSRLCRVARGSPKWYGQNARYSDRTGQASAAAILALRARDGSDTPLQDLAYPQGTNPGEYRFTPGFNFVFAPGWGRVTPFVLRNGSQFRPGPPYQVGSNQYTADFNEVKAIGGDNVTTPSPRTLDQTQIGLFWLESSPLAWNRIARSVSASRGLDLGENARLFGLLNLALADGYIASWDTKYHYSFWRPVTAIHTADSDGNPDTVGDATWTPLQLTYPIPDYDSGHSVQGGTAAQVLRDFFGTDDISFSACSLTLPPGSRCTDPSPVFRAYTNFSQAAEENGLSRILVGIHFRHAVREGIQHGRKIGNRAVNMLLLRAGVIPGDVDANGVVDCADVRLIRAAFGKRTGQPGFDARADVDTDGIIDVRDLAYVSQRLPVGARCN